MSNCLYRYNTIAVRLSPGLCSKGHHCLHTFAALEDKTVDLSYLASNVNFSLFEAQLLQRSRAKCCYSRPGGKETWFSCIPWSPAAVGVISTWTMPLRCRTSPQALLCFNALWECQLWEEQGKYASRKDVGANMSLAVSQLAHALFSSFPT